MTNYRRRRKPKKTIGKKYNINRRIQADKMRVIDEEGGMVGILSRDEALNVAEERELDLVEINPKADPPVIKLIDFNKFKYQVSKSGADKKKKEESKTFRVSVRVAENDLQVRANKINDVLEKGGKARLQVQMKGREKAYPEVAKEVIEKFLGMVTADYDFENEVKLTGDSYFAVIKPNK